MGLHFFIIRASSIRIVIRRFLTIVVVGTNIRRFFGGYFFKEYGFVDG